LKPIILYSLVALALAATPPPLQAQQTQSSRDPAVIATQLRQALQVGRKALAGLHTLPADDAVPIDPAVLEAARETYILVRAARHGMELARERQRFPDPMLDVAFKRVDEAWNLSRTPADKASWGLPRRQYLDMSIRDLTRALHLLDQALLLLP
jgi:hypothetical protein